MRSSFAHLILTLGLLPCSSLLAVPGDPGREGNLPANPATAPAAGVASAPAAGARPAPVERVSSQSHAPGYPYVYRQVGYLATMGPVPMRFGPASPTANERTPPRVPTVNKRNELSQTAEAMARTEAIEAYRSIHNRRLPVPDGSIPGGPHAPSAFSDQGGLSTGSNEVLEFFQQPPPDQEVVKRQNRFLFDPVPPFSSATPPAMVTQPQSRATYQKN